MPNANEIVYLSHSNIVFTSGASMGEGIAYLAPFKDRVNLGLMYGALLPDPGKLLEGTGKNMRHIKVKKAEQLEDPALRALIRAAIAQGNPSA